MFRTWDIRRCPMLRSSYVLRNLFVRRHQRPVPVRGALRPAWSARQFPLAWPRLFRRRAHLASADGPALFCTGLRNLSTYRSSPESFLLPAAVHRTAARKIQPGQLRDVGNPSAAHSSHLRAAACRCNVSCRFRRSNDRAVPAQQALTQGDRMQ